MQGARSRRKIPPQAAILRNLTGPALCLPHSHPNFSIQTSLFPAITSTSLTASHALSSERRLRNFETLHAAADCWCLPDRRAVSVCTTQADPSRAWLLTLVNSTKYCISLVQALPAHALGIAARLHLPVKRPPRPSGKDSSSQLLLLSHVHSSPLGPGIPFLIPRSQSPGAARFAFWTPVCVLGRIYRRMLYSSRSLISALLFTNGAPTLRSTRFVPKDLDFLFSTRGAPARQPQLCDLTFPTSRRVIGALALAVVYETFSVAFTKHPSASLGEQKTSPLHGLTRQASTDVSKPTEPSPRALNSLQDQVGGKPLAPRPDQASMVAMTHPNPTSASRLCATTLFLHHACGAIVSAPACLEHEQSIRTANLRFANHDRELQPSGTASRRRERRRLWAWKPCACRSWRPAERISHRRVLS